MRLFKDDTGFTAKRQTEHEQKSQELLMENKPTQKPPAQGPEKSRSTDRSMEFKDVREAIERCNQKY